MIRIGKLGIWLLAMSCAQPAAAEWFEATSKHFIVYANGTADAVQKHTVSYRQY